MSRLTLIARRVQRSSTRVSSIWERCLRIRRVIEAGRRWCIWGERRLRSGRGKVTVTSWCFHEVRSILFALCAIFSFLRFVSLTRPGPVFSVMLAPYCRLVPFSFVSPYCIFTGITRHGYLQYPAKYVSTSIAREFHFALSLDFTSCKRSCPNN
jgi:hypothetical protein